VRRDPKAIVAAHRFDPARKELYVEGSSDRLFLTWLTAGTRHVNARIIEISSVNIPSTAGGERGRLISFAEYVASTAARILVFADADTDRLRNVSSPVNVLLTDARDMEAYVLRYECVEKIARLGLASEHVDVQRFVLDVTATSRVCGAIRFASDADGLNLPFQKVTVDRYARVRNGEFEVDLRGFVQTLLQAAGISIREVERVIARGHEIATLFGNTPDLVHGKDAMRLADVYLKRHDVRPDEARRMLWCAFERSWAHDYSALAKVVDFLETP
jgi:hypothetical protein